MQAWLNLDADDRQTAFHMPGDVKVNSRIDVSRHDRSAGSPLKRAGLISVHVTRPYNGRSNAPEGASSQRGASPLQANALQPVTECNCDAAMRGGEQQEVKRPVRRMTNSIRPGQTTSLLDNGE